MKEAITSGFRPLAGLEVSRVTYAGNMRNIQFGPLRRSKRGYVGLYALHIQCPWRVERGGRILTGFHDYGYAADGSPDTWNGVMQDGLQQRILESWFGGLGEDGVRTSVRIARRVKGVVGDRFGGFTMRLTGDLRLRVFPAGSAGEEWRLFRPGIAAAAHMVIEGQRVVWE